MTHCKFIVAYTVGYAYDICNNDEHFVLQLHEIRSWYWSDACGSAIQEGA